jgi:hypothetical protein
MSHTSWVWLGCKHWRSQTFIRFRECPTNENHSSRQRTRWRPFTGFSEGEIYSGKFEKLVCKGRKKHSLVQLCLFQLGNQFLILFLDYLSMTEVVFHDNREVSHEGQNWECRELVSGEIIPSWLLVILVIEPSLKRKVCVPNGAVEPSLGSENTQVLWEVCEGVEVRVIKDGWKR